MVHPDDGRRSEIVMDAAGRSCEVDEDYISGLPDDLLHNILLRLRSTAAAARTSVLSRRWLRVWAHLPDLEHGNFRAPAAAVDSVLDSIDAAMAASQALAIDSLCITVEKENRTRQLPLAAIPAHRVIAWLRFASRRRVRRLNLSLPADDDMAARAPRRRVGGEGRRRRWRRCRSICSPWRELQASCSTSDTGSASG